MPLFISVHVANNSIEKHTVLGISVHSVGMHDVGIQYSDGPGVRVRKTLFCLSSKNTYWYWCLYKKNTIFFNLSLAESFYADLKMSADWKFKKKLSQHILARKIYRMILFAFFRSHDTLPFKKKQLSRSVR